MVLDTSQSAPISMPWYVEDTKTTLIARITNGIPVEYDITDNEASKKIGGTVSLSFTTTPASCHFVKDGKAKVIVGGIQPPYSIEWSTGQTTDTITEYSGTYTVNVRDNNQVVIASGSVTITENPFNQVNVSINTNSSTVCINTMATLTASATNGGSAPIYQWIKNGVNVGTNSNTYSYYPTNGDTISCMLTSNIYCSSNNPAMSNSIIFNITDYTVVNGGITGLSPVCQGQSGVLYTIPTITNATSYIWTLPSGAYGYSNTNTINVDFGTNAASGNIIVIGSNACGYSTPSSMMITVNPLPNNAGAITGLTNVCQNVNSIVYSVPVIPHADSYVWTLPNGATGSSTTNTISVDFGPNASTGMLTVRGLNACGLGVPSSLYVTVTHLPGNAGTILGYSNINAQGDYSTTYLVPVISSATSYIWTLPDGSTQTTLTNTIVFNCGTILNSGTLTVMGHNSCGNGGASSKYINVVTNKKLRTHAMIQGLYDGNSLMYPTMEYDPNIDDMVQKFINPPAVDTISLLIRSLKAPNYNVLAEFHNLKLSENGTISELNLPSCIDAYNYIVIVHRNSTDTWSDSINFSDTLINYNFYTHPASNQFAGNMLEVTNNNTYVGSLIWSGDIVKDGTLNIFDLSDVFDMLNNPNAPIGYILEDLNGDGVANIFDLSIVFDNLNIGAGSVNPFTLK